MNSSLPKSNKDYLNKCVQCHANSADYIYRKACQRMKRHSRKWACNVNDRFKDCVLAKSFSHKYTSIYIYIYIYTYLWRALSQKMISKFGIGIATSILGLVLNALWKSALQIHFCLWRTLFELSKLGICITDTFSFVMGLITLWKKAHHICI